jgi:hypothetical protein
MGEAPKDRSSLRENTYLPDGKGKGACLLASNHQTQGHCGFCL